MYLAQVAVSGWLLVSGAVAPGEADPVGGEETGEVAPRVRLDLQTGIGVRDDRLDAAGVGMSTSGAASSHLMLDGTWFSQRNPVGFAGRLGVERFEESVQGEGAVGLVGFDLSGAVVGRIPSSGGRLVVEGQFGYGLVHVPFAARDGAGPGMSLTAHALDAHGPLLAAGVTFAPAPWMALEATARAMPTTFGAQYQGMAMNLLRVDVGLAATLGHLEAGGLSLSGVLGYDLRTTRGTGDAGALTQVRRLYSVGLRAAVLAPPPRYAAPAGGSPARE